MLSSLLNLVSIMSISLYLEEYQFFSLSTDCVLTDGTITVIAGPEPVIPAALAPFTKASFAIFLPARS